MQRIFLLIGINILVMVVLSVAAHILAPMLGIPLDNSLITLIFFGFIFGFGGAFISLWMSKFMAKFMMGVKIIESPRNRVEEFIFETVKNQAATAGIGMPEIGIFESAMPNAFATGASKNNALVAVSTGLLNSLSKEEVEAVLGHEISHISNGDMITMTLLQGVLNTFVFVIARIIASAVMRGRESPWMYFMVVMVLQILFGILASVVLMWFSRRREFRADEGGARLAGRQKMIDALAAIQRSTQPNAEPLPNSAATLGINGSGVKSLFRSHPPIESRIAYLESLPHIM